MARIAVDAVLLPEAKTMDLAIEINQRLVREYHSEIVLNKENCTPHISLAMGGLDEAALDAVANVLRGLAQGTAVRRLEIVGILSSTNSRGETTSVLEIAKTAALQTLHEQTLHELAPFLTHEVTAEMISDDVVAPSTLDWIRNYAAKAAFARFTPHITLGYGEVRPGPAFPLPFRVTRLALCHLGNHCTCRKILASANLL